MKNTSRRPLRGVLSSMAVLSLTAAGLAVGFAPAATAAPGDPIWFYTNANSQPLWVYDHHPNTGQSLYVESGYTSGTNYQFDDTANNRHASTSARSYMGSLSLDPEVQAQNTDSEPGGFVGPKQMTGPAASVDGFNLDASTNTVEANQSVDPTTCLPLGVPLFESSTSTNVELSPRNDGNGVHDLLTTDGAKTGHTKGTMFSNGVPGHRGVNVVSEGGTGTYWLLNNTVKVEIVQAATSRSTVDGVTRPVSDMVAATIRVTDPNGGVIINDDTTGPQTLNFTDPATGLRMTLRLNEGYEYVAGDENGGHPYAQNYMTPVRAVYNESTEGEVTLGYVSTVAQLRTGGVNCAEVDSDNDGLSDTDETNVHNTNPNNPDSDDDGLNDGAEVNTHSTQPNNADTDDDGLNDGAEVNTHSTQPNNPDSDDDGLNDGAEVNTHSTQPNNADTDGDNLTDGDEVNTHDTKPLVIDTDTDGLRDGEEVHVYLTKPKVADTDEDGLLDGAEVNENANGYTSDPTKADTDGGKSSDFDESSAGTDPRDATDDYRLQDADEDGLTGAEEDFHNTNPNNPDTDGDNLTDGAEVNTHDTDPTRADSDEDGLDDGDEVARGTDASHPDTDRDFLEDGPEVNTHLTDPKVADTDDDGLDDGDEVRTYETNPLVKDTDEDGLNDGAEVNKHDTDPTRADSDNDGVNDGAEIANGTKPWDEDTDRDNLTDGGEVKAGTNPLVQDTDEDGLWDGDEVRIGSSPLKKDTDGGSVDDWTEYDRGTDPLNPLDDVKPVVPPTTDPPVVYVPADSDNDGLTDDEEAKLGTDPLSKHSDGDRLGDAREVKLGTDPLSKHSDGDRLGDAREVKLGTNPLSKDTDRDGLGDFREVVKTHTNPLRKDTDKDGVNDRREVKAGSDPTDRKSTPRNR